MAIDHRYPDIIKKRIFIVGCPRSGTTLLQGVLASHPEVYSLPETFFFAKAISRNWVKNKFIHPSLKVRNHLRSMLQVMNRQDLKGVGKVGFFQSDYHSPFLRVMDQLTLDSGGTVWVEKTPMHLYFIEEIQKLIPDAVFIHIVRNGMDVVPSLVKATQENHKKWASVMGWRRLSGWKGYSIEEAIQRWNTDFSISQKYQRIPGHLIVKYEELILNPEAVSKSLCEELEIEFNPEMLDASSSYENIVSSFESWKINNRRKIGFREPRPGDYVSEEDRKKIEVGILKYELNCG